MATLRSFSAFCCRRGWLDAALADGLERRREPVDRTKAIPYAQLDRLWRGDDLAVRGKALWRLVYETAARAQGALSLNVEDVDLDNKRARVRSKGGDVEWLALQAGSARLLPRLIAGRPRGPLFLADRRPAPARMPAAADRCPSTGRARLSYRRAEELFCDASGGWTLHQLRPSAITHLAEADVGLPLLIAKGRHGALRRLQRYSRPGPQGGRPADRRPRPRTPPARVSAQPRTPRWFCGSRLGHCYGRPVRTARASNRRVDAASLAQRRSIHGGAASEL